MRSPRALVACAALAALGTGVGLGLPATAASPHATAPAPATYLVGADVESIAPTQAMINSGIFYLGGYGITNGKALDTVQTPVPGRAATGVLGTNGDGIHVRALAIGDHHNVIELAQIETQGYFASYKQGPFGIEEIRKDAARKIAALSSSLGQIGPGAILVNSNHTHAGPDTTGVWGGVPTTYLKLVHDRTVTALVNAYKAMVPATLTYGVAHAGVAGEPDLYPASDPLLTNQFSDDPRNQVVDDEVRVLQATSTDTGKVVATYVNYSSHPTVLGSSNTLASSDYTGPLSDDLASFGGVGFEQVATLGRTQPARDGCPDSALTGAAASRCAIEAYAGRVFDRVKTALAAARPLTGNPIVAMHSYLMQDATTNAPLLAFGYAGYAAGAPIYRSVNPPWFTANIIGAPSFSGRIGNILISGGPGEMYPQIPAAVRRLVPAAGYLNIGTAGDFLGYIVSPVSAYPEPIRRSMFDGAPPPDGNTCQGVHSPVGCPDPVGNDNYFFNISHTFGLRLTCSLLRGAGDVMRNNSKAFWSERKTCASFGNDMALPKDFDTTFPEQPYLTKVLKK
jgi:hypothetical protein